MLEIERVMAPSSRMRDRLEERPFLLNLTRLDEVSSQKHFRRNQTVTDKNV